MRNRETELNEAAFRRMEERINNSYPLGQFIGIVGGEIIADAADFDDLHKKLSAAGKDPFKALIVQAGHSYPKYATILIGG